MPSGANTTANNGKDTTKTNTSKWKDENVNITYTRLGSMRQYVPDSSLHTYQRGPFLGEWGRDLGNIGSPVSNLFFTPEFRVGPTLGYHIYDAYRFQVDSLNFYNTNHPYSVFSYSLGSKQEQVASLMHSQNIRPNWNMTFEYRKVYSPGFYQINRNNHDVASVSTNGSSLDKHYQFFAAMVYNHIQHDENGGLVYPEQLTDAAYTDRKTLDVAYENSGYSATRSSAYNDQRDFTLLLQHSYTWGHTDTVYSADSTQFRYHLVPRFSISHKLELSTEKHTYDDVSPDSARYVTLFAHSFVNNGTGYYVPGEDSVYVQQNWFWIDNKIMLNGFIGPQEHPVEFSAGLGNRYDEFISRPIRDSIYDSFSTTVASRNNLISNYLEGQVKKEAAKPGEWEYGASLRLFLTGEYAGNFVANAALGRALKDGWGSFVAGFRESANSAPYSYTNYENFYTKNIYGFVPENVNELYASVESARLRISGGVNSYVINDYIYINQNETPAQYTIPFNLSQAWLRKVFKIGNIYLDNELTYQQAPDAAPLNLPAVMGRHQLSYERNLFQRKLKVELGTEVRYTTAYHPQGYDALLNRFFYQNATYVSNPPEVSVFLNFRVRRFRAFVMGENLQALIFRNNILYTGTPVYNFSAPGSVNIPIYASPDALIRFGFSWPLVN